MYKHFSMDTIHTVLLVDDDEISLFLNIHVITKLKVRNIEVRNSGREALEYLRNCESVGKAWPDLILLDMYMPEMDGNEFLEEYRLLDSPKKEDTRIVVVSTMRNDRNRIALSKSHGVDFYVEKPLSESKIVQVLQNVPFNGL